MLLDWVTLRNSPSPPRGVALTNFTGPCDFYSSTTNPAYLLTGVNELAVGSVLRLTAFGVFSTTGTPTLALGFYYGATALTGGTTALSGGASLGTSLATATASGAVNFPWRAEYTGVVRAIGTAGSIEGAGFVMLGTSVSAGSFLPLPSAALAAVAIDTSAPKMVCPTATWGTPSASNTITCWGFTIESL